jgi:glycosyltransferase involved in cell wall biosynthesis
MPSLHDVASRLIKVPAVRAGAGAAFLAKGAALGLVDPYRRISDFCWVERVSATPALQRIAHRAIERYMAGPAVDGESALVRAFLASPVSRAARQRWLPADGTLDSAFRDIMVLKAPGPGERGVLILKYSAKFDLFVSLFDLRPVMRDYTIVLEPCWAGYSDPSILMFRVPGEDVVIQCPEDADFRYITDLRSNLVPVRLGAADWVDQELFATEPEPQPKQYDVIMVANWAKHKNHDKLFAALPKTRTRPLSVLLLGFDLGGRTDADIRREMAAYDLAGISVEIKKSLPPAEVAAHLHRSKVFVLLSEKEGANKAIVEALFAGVPAIVYEGFVGGARAKINDQTGILSSFEELAGAIDRMVAAHARFTPRAWALEHTGSRNATRQLNERLMALALARGEVWTRDIVEKVNAPNLAYKQSGAIPLEQQAKAIAPRYLRAVPAADRSAVPSASTRATSTT